MRPSVKPFAVVPASSDDKLLYTEFTALQAKGVQTWIAIGGFDFSDDGPTHNTWYVGKTDSMLFPFLPSECPLFPRTNMSGHRLTPGQDAEIDRIMKAFRANAYDVLGLVPGVAPDAIKKTYRRKSLLIHPDKSTNPNAQDAFDRLAQSYQALLDDAKREKLDEAFADARMLLIRENKWTIDSPELKTDEFAKKWRDKAREVLVDNEHRRRRQLKAQMQEEGREQRRQDEEVEERKRKRQHDQDWEATRDTRINSWRDFQSGKGGAPKKKKKLKPIG